MRALRHVVPHAVRRSVSMQMARARAARLERRLAALAAGAETIVAGPWLGEVGFELLYWAPFLAWFVERFGVAPERLLVVSRGGVASWYPAGVRYREIFEQLSPAAYRARHDERVAANGEQKQTRVLAFERDLLRELTADVAPRTMLHPSTMYELFNPYWWGHVDEGWVHAYTRYRRLSAPEFGRENRPRGEYVAVKFYFNDCFPPTEENRASVRRLLEGLTVRGEVVSLTTGLQLDDHGGLDVQALGVRTIRQHAEPAVNLALQSTLVAGARAFVGTYGGFSYLAPFYGVRSFAYYADAGGFSRRHLQMARSAFAAVGAPDLLDVRPLTNPVIPDLD